MHCKCSVASELSYATVLLVVLFSQGSSKFDELFQFLNVYLPFGSPLEIDMPSMSCVLQSSKAQRNLPTPRVKVGVCVAGVFKVNSIS